ncbi:CBS domain-containing protein [Agrobacterium vitis]|uniref:CBS domain-containing protein n=1 Tax=Agrobacterium vitis TaxID=373 RepID=UPI003D2CB423
MDVRIETVMTKSPIVITPEAKVSEAAAVMLGRRISGLPVVDAKNQVVGIVTEGDFLRRGELGTERRNSWLRDWLTNPGKLAEDYIRTHGRRIDEVMTTTLITVSPTASLSEAVDLMERHNIKRLPVISDGVLVGIISRADVLRALAQHLPKSASTSSDLQILRAVEEQFLKQSWSENGSIRCDVVDGVAELSGCIFDERERVAAKVLVGNVPGGRSVIDRLVWIEPYSGMVVSPPDAVQPK